MILNNIQQFCSLILSSVQDPNLWFIYFFSAWHLSFRRGCLPERDAVPTLSLPMGVDDLRQ